MWISLPVLWTVKAQVQGGLAVLSWRSDRLAINHVAPSSGGGRLRRGSICAKMKDQGPPHPEAPFWLSGMSEWGFTSGGHRLSSLYRVDSLAP
jgi:hypothetical protein